MKSTFIACMVFCILLLSYNINLYSQSGCSGPLADCNFVEKKIETGKFLDDPGCLIDIEYDIYECNGIKSIEIIDITVRRGICEGMRDFSIYHYDFSAIYEMVMLSILEELAYADQPLSTCGSGQKNYYDFYTASCGIWLSCEYDIDPQTPDCETGYDPLPDPTATTVKTWKWQSCGTTCCKRKYQICYDPSYGTIPLNVITFPPVPLTECTGQSNYAKPCDNGC